MNVYECSMCIQGLILTLNDLHIMVIVGIYIIEYIKILCEMFTKYIVAIIQVYPNYFIILLKIIKTNNYYYICTIVFIYNL